MIIGSVSENKNLEKRVAITPDVLKKYKSLGVEICISKNYANHLGFTDNDYQNEGVQILDKEEEVIKKSDVIIQMNILSDENLNFLKQNQILIGVLNPYSNKDKLESLTKKKNRLLFT